MRQLASMMWIPVVEARALLLGAFHGRPILLYGIKTTE